MGSHNFKKFNYYETINYNKKFYIVIFMKSSMSCSMNKSDSPLFPFAGSWHILFSRSHTAQTNTSDLKEVTFIVRIVEFEIEWELASVVVIPLKNS